MAALNDADGSMAQAIDELSKLGCHAAMTTQAGHGFDQRATSGVDGERRCGIGDADPEKVAVVFPSMRHELEA